ncbi:MAG: hypothetical protein EPO57_07665 [Chitinophagaceae bacterium]|nr:MAG: hypothetical protein EPO57_07665 [Chitinophagaceae bacterium]
MVKKISCFWVAAFLLLSCSKSLEDRLVGEWRLLRSYNKEPFGRDYFQTGFQEGKFKFNESGIATYYTSTDTLNGFWETDYYFKTGYNGESEREKYLHLYLANFQRSQILYWKFDEFNFKENWKIIKAVDKKLGWDKHYEFERQ